MAVYSMQEHLSRLIDAAGALGKSQRDIARELGYDRPTMVSMLKSGAVRLPIGKIIPFARAVGYDPVMLFELSMKDYAPETWAAFQELYGDQILSAMELPVVEAMRNAARGGSIAPASISEQQAFQALLEAIATRNASRN